LLIRDFGRRQVVNELQQLIAEGRSESILHFWRAVNQEILKSSIMTVIQDVSFQPLITIDDANLQLVTQAGFKVED
jgi:hypothetical protein